MLLQGLFVPLTCPFYRDGEIYLRKLEHNVARYSLSPAAGLIALAPQAEADSLTDEEAYSFLRTAVQAAGKTKVLLAGVQRGSVAAALQMAAHAEQAGFDAIVLSPPADWPRLQPGLSEEAQGGQELRLFYEVVADRSPLPVVLWSDKRQPSMQLPPEFVGALAAHRNVIGLMDADLSEERLRSLLQGTGGVQREVTVTAIFEAVTRRMQQPQPALHPGLQPAPVTGSGFVAAATLTGGVPAAPAAAAAPPAEKRRTKTVGFQILAAGAASGMVPLLAAGATGAAPALAACAPQSCFEAYAAWKDGDMALAEERAARLPRADTLVEQFGPATVKAGCDLNGYYGGHPRLPRLPLVAEARRSVEEALALVRN